MADKTIDTTRLREALDYLVSQARGSDYVDERKLFGCEGVVEDAYERLQRLTAGVEALADHCERPLDPAICPGVNDTTRWFADGVMKGVAAEMRKHLDGDTSALDAVRAEAASKALTEAADEMLSCERSANTRTPTGDARRRAFGEARNRINDRAAALAPQTDERGGR